VRAQTRKTTPSMSAKQWKWFEELFGFNEQAAGYAKVQAKLSLQGSVLKSSANGAEFQVGQFSTPSLAALREEGSSLLRSIKCEGAALTVDHIAVDSALDMHARHPGAFFQAASQFNCLEFSNQYVTPEHGVTQYITDPTQGPACALACAAGSVVRNYLIPVKPGVIGQRAGE
jgi:hypothetical protein